MNKLSTNPPRFNRSLLLAIFVIVVSDVLLGKAATLCIPQFRYEEDLIRGKSMRIRSQQYHHGLAANVSAKHRWGKRIYVNITNSEGFKDESTRNVPHQNKNRILFMGDSFTEGIGYVHAETFVGIIDQKLKEKKIDVVNAGVASYAPIIYWKKIEGLIRKGLEFQEVIVFLDISDIWDETRYYFNEKGEIKRLKPTATERLADYDHEKYYTQTAKVRRFLKRNSLSMRVIAFVRLLWLTCHEPRPNVFELDAYRWTWEQFQSEEVQKGLRSASFHLTQLSDLLKNHKIKMTLVIYPASPQIIKTENLDLYQDYWKTWSVQQGVNFLDLFPDFQKLGNSKDVFRNYFIPLDVHLNKKGHQFVASRLIEFLNR